MITRVTRQDFLRDMDSKNFSHEALNAIFDHYEHIEDEEEVTLVFDIEEVAGAWTEYKSIEEWAKEFGVDFEEETYVEGYDDPAEWVSEYTGATALSLSDGAFVMLGDGFVPRDADSPFEYYVYEVE